MTNSEIVESYIEEFGEGIPNLTLAKLIYRKHQKRFTNLESARSAVRYVTGNNGKDGRIKRKSKSKFFKKNGESGGKIFDLLPEPIKSLEWSVYELDCKKCLKLGDIHIPFFDKVALIAALEYGKKENVDTILLNGDIVDFYALSKYEKNPELRDFDFERESAISFFNVLRKFFPNQKILWKLGNHEERYEKYVMVKAPELYGTAIKTFEELFLLDEFNIEVIKDKRPIKIANLYVMHGHEFGSISSAVNPSRALYNKAKTFCIMDHLHRTSESSEVGLDEDLIVCWSSGCLCELHPAYAPINKWNHGFSIIEKVGDKKFKVKNYKIVDGIIY